MKRRLSHYFSLFFLVLLSICFFVYHYAFAPYGEGGSFYIRKGMSVSQIAEQLESQGFIRLQSAFKFLVRAKKNQNKIHFGEYEIPKNISPLQILDLFVLGKVVEFKVTFPEGWNYQEITEKLVSLNIGTKQEYINYFTDTQLIALLPFTVSNLEGYLYPDTYRYDHYTQAKDILMNMIENFSKNWTNEFATRAEQLQLLPAQIITLASIVEKETAREDERSRIAGVYHNRLKIGMPLGADPTVIYGIKNFDGNLTRQHLQEDQPYNTYLRKGLPPTPIASPGLASIRATLFPEQHDYLFFVAMGNASGHSYFSKNYQEHQQAVEKYQIKKINN